MLTPHSREWYERLARWQSGYFYNWRSRVDEGNGEDAYVGIVRRHLTTASDVLDVGCGNGAHALELGPHCRSVVAYDRVAAWIERAESDRRANGARNVTFLCHDSSPDANGGYARMPGTPQSYDLVISRRGPLHWIADARRVARPGATLLMLLPEGTRALNRQVPWLHLLRAPFSVPTEPLAPPFQRTVGEALEAACLALDGWWVYDVREWFDTPRDLYDCLSFWWRPDAPGWDESRSTFERIFREYAIRGSVWLPHGRTIWRAR